MIEMSNAKRLVQAILESPVDAQWRFKIAIEVLGMSECRGLAVIASRIAYTSYERATRRCQQSLEEASRLVTTADEILSSDPAPIELHSAHQRARDSVNELNAVSGGVYKLCAASAAIVHAIEAIIAYDCDDTAEVAESAWKTAQAAAAALLDRLSESDPYERFVSIVRDVLDE
jgi:hypothetical protein